MATPACDTYMTTRDTSTEKLGLALVETKGLLVSKNSGVFTLFSCRE